MQSSSKTRNVKSLPNMPDGVPESFYDLLEKMLVIRHKQRPSAVIVLNILIVNWYISPPSLITPSVQFFSVFQSQNDRPAPKFVTVQQLCIPYCSLKVFACSRDGNQRRLSTSLQRSGAGGGRRRASAMINRPLRGSFRAATRDKSFAAASRNLDTSNHSAGKISPQRSAADVVRGEWAAKGLIMDKKQSTQMGSVAYWPHAERYPM